jgi:hypothetical protein
MRAGVRLAKALGELADCAHDPVLYLLIKQNRELQYASLRQGKPCKSSCQVMLYKGSELLI